MICDPLADFIRRVETVVADSASSESDVLRDVTAAMRTLIADDSWLPASCAQPHPVYYRQYLLHADPQDRFSVVSFVWGPGQCTPIHDHCTWGVVGVLRGAEINTSFTEGEAGMRAGREETLQPGDVAVLSPETGDIHQVRNAYADRVSISIHAYGTNIGKQTRHVFDPASGARKDFVSGYTSPDV